MKMPRKEEYWKNPEKHRVYERMRLFSKRAGFKQPKHLLKPNKSVIERVKQVLNRMNPKRWYFISDLSKQAQLSKREMERHLAELKFRGRVENRIINICSHGLLQGHVVWRKLE